MGAISKTAPSATCTQSFLGPECLSLTFPFLWTATYYNQTYSFLLLLVPPFPTSYLPAQTWFTIIFAE